MSFLRYLGMLCLVTVRLYGQSDDSVHYAAISLVELEVIDYYSEPDLSFKNSEISLTGINRFSDYSLGDLIGNTSPIYFKDYSFGGIKTIDLRGTGAPRTQVFWNGMPINSPTVGQFDFSILPAYMLDEVRLRFGGSSLIDGGGGLGGSLQLQNPLLFEENSVLITLGYGSFNQKIAGFKVKWSTGKLKSDTRFYYREATNNYDFRNEFKKDHPIEKRKHNELLQLGFQQLLNYKINANNTLGFKFSINDLDRNIPDVISSNGTGSDQKDQLIMGQINWQWLVKPYAFVKLRTGFQEQLNRFNDFLSVDATNRVTGWNSNLNAGLTKWERLKFSANINLDKYWISSYGAGQMQEFRTSSLINASFAPLKSISLEAGLRNSSAAGVFSPLMFYGGMEWKIAEKWGRLQANISQIYRFPTINDRFWLPGGNPDLRPEKGVNYELEYKQEKNFRKAQIGFQVTFFYGVISDWIQWQPMATSVYWTAQNVWKVNNRGAEINVFFEKNINSDLMVKLEPSYAYTRVMKLANDNATLLSENEQLRLIPVHQIRIPFEFKWKNSNVMFNYRYVSERSIDKQINLALDPYAILDFGFQYHWDNPNIALSFKLNNLFNTVYETVPGQPLPGFNFQLEINYTIL